MLLLQMLLASEACRQAPIRKVEQIPDSVLVQRDVRFLPGDRAEKADIYRPAAQTPAAKKLPAVVIIHGGGFNSGDKGNAREINIGTNLALNGYLAMSVNYVLAGQKEGKTWPGPVLDCKRAVVWLRENSEKLGIDPRRIGVIGGSAGGTLAALLALTGPCDGFEPADLPPGIDTRVSCAVDLYGIADMLTHHDMRTMGASREADPAIYKKGSPVTYAAKKASPLLILHGTADKTVDPEQSRLLAKALKDAGAEHELVIIPGAPHTFDLQPKQRDLRPLVIGFLDRHLK